MLASAGASPWARPGGELLVISRGEYFRTELDSFETPQGVIDSRFDRFESNTYVEFGLTENITLGGKALYGTTWFTRGPDVDTANGFSEIEAFAQYQFLRNNTHAGSVRIAAAKPARFQSGARTILQSDKFDTELAALYGRNLIRAPIKVFTAIETGYRKRWGDAADQIKSQATIGVEPSSRLLFLLEGFSTFSLRNERDNGADFDVVKVQPSIVFRFSSKWAVQAGVSEEIAGRNLELGRTYFIGVWSSF
ncbi:hypothetical protein [Hyphococcus sp.]|uniref:hypothetical protein n=1 Tax=Hyphococcus sp. TaxID=2038636 RepID=UPI003CCC2EE1